MAYSNGAAKQMGSPSLYLESIGMSPSTKSSPSSLTSFKESDAEKTITLQKLCYYLNGKVKDNHMKSMYTFAREFVNSHRGQTKNKNRTNQFYGDKITQLVSVNRGPNDKEQVENSLRQIKELNMLKQQKNVLHFLLMMANKTADIQPTDNDKTLTTIMPVKPASKSSSATAVAPASILSLSELPVIANAMPQRTQPTNCRINGEQLAFVSEAQLVQDVIYVFQGVNGTFMKYSPVSQEYVLDKVSVSRGMRTKALRLAQLGWLHNKVREHCDSWVATRCVGAVAQSFTAALREQLTEYYRLLANLQTQVNTAPADDAVTLHDLIMWYAVPRERFAVLANAVDHVKGQRGGAILSTVHAMLQHGDPAVQDIVRHLLAAVCKPVFRMLSRWMMDGELDDPHGEFFIVGNREISGDRLWDQKYCVQELMVPSFMTATQADKVLATGKSINFLREVCKDRVDLCCRDKLSQGLEASSVEALVISDRVGELTALMDVAYLETSRRVIDVLNNKYKLGQHLQAMRDFLLLGQGDFIRYLMELLEPELVKPGTEVFSHNLSSILDTAIRATNAQYADPDVLRRLDVRILSHSPGDCGWDIFALDYHTKGPIGTVFASTTTPYLLLFQSLWKAKRIEFILSRMWKQQFTASKMLLRSIPELHTVLQQTHLLTHEMVHTVHQLQYYVMFEVIECSWEELIKNMRNAESLDGIIHAHRDFVDKVKQGALIDSKSTDLSMQMRGMFDTILQLKSVVDLLHDRAHEEVAMRSRRQAEIKESVALGAFGTDNARDKVYEQATHVFLHKFLPNTRIQLKTLANTYQRSVRKLIQMLATSGNVNLQLLSFRLDFSEHYRRSEQASGLSLLVK